MRFALLHDVVQLLGGKIKFTLHHIHNNNRDILEVLSV